MSFAAPTEPATPADGGIWEILIVGSGFAGLCMAIQLRKAGHRSFVMLEADAEVGGT